MPISRVLVRLLRHHEQGPAGAVIAVRPAQADRLVAEGIARLDAIVMPPAPVDAVETPEPETATAAPSRPRRKR